MKKIIYLMGLFSLALWSCDDMNDINQHWIDRGEIIYTGAVDSLKIQPGNNRLQLEWQMNADPRISELIIRWNNKKDSIIVPVVRDTEEKIGIYKDAILIDKGLEEGTTVFQLYTRDNKGHSSVVREVTADVYGGNYAEAASFRMPRKITSIATIDDTGAAQLTFEKIETTDMLDTKLVYTSYGNLPAGEKKTVTIDNSMTSIVVEHIRLGDEIELYSTFIPTPDAIDAFPGKMATTRIPLYFLLDKERWESLYKDKYTPLDKTGWTTWASTEELSGEGATNGRAAAIIDGDMSTFWHSAWQSTTPELPHIIEVDMKTQQTIYSLEFARRKGNKDLKTAVFEISMDKQSWKEIGRMTFSADGGQNMQVFMFPNPVATQYLRIKVTESHNSRHASIAEIILGTKN